jgi:hypothetical protein
MDNETRTLTIRYANGQIDVFEFGLQSRDSLIKAQGIKDLIEADKLIIELEDRLMVIPYNQVNSIEVTPLLGHLPKRTIRNARQKGMKGK